MRRVPTYVPSSPEADQRRADRAPPPDVLHRRDGQGDRKAAAGVGRGLQPPAEAAGRRGVSNERQIRVGGAGPPQAAADSSPLVLPAAVDRLTVVDAQMDCNSPVLPALAAIQALEREVVEYHGRWRRAPRAGSPRRGKGALVVAPSPPRMCRRNGTSWTPGKLLTNRA